MFVSFDATVANTSASIATAKATAAVVVVVNVVAAITTNLFSIRV